MRVPIVRMMRQPPEYVPSAIADAAEMITQVGGSGLGPSSVPCATSASVMMPIVFWASFVPCDSDSRLALTIWPRR